MAQKLKENIAPPGDLGLFPNTYMAAYNYGLIPVLVDPISSSSFHGVLHTCGTYKKTQTGKHIHIN